MLKSDILNLIKNYFTLSFKFIIENIMNINFFLFLFNKDKKQKLKNFLLELLDFIIIDSNNLFNNYKKYLKLICDILYDYCLNVNLLIFLFNDFNNINLKNTFIKILKYFGFEIIFFFVDLLLYNFIINLKYEYNDTDMESYILKHIRFSKIICYSFRMGFFNIIHELFKNIIVIGLIKTIIYNISNSKNILNDIINNYVKTYILSIELNNFNNYVTKNIDYQKDKLLNDLFLTILHFCINK